MLRSSSFLNYRPSQIASASILMAINISISTNASELNLKQLNEFDLYEKVFDPDVQSSSSIKTVSKDPLRHWSCAVKKVTGISADRDIRPTYDDLLTDLNKFVYESELTDEALFSQ